MSRAISAADIEVITAQVLDNVEGSVLFGATDPKPGHRKESGGLHPLDKSVTFEQIGNARVWQMLDDVLGSGNWQRPVRQGFRALTVVRRL